MDLLIQGSSTGLEIAARTRTLWTSGASHFLPAEEDCPRNVGQSATQRQHPALAILNLRTSSCVLSKGKGRCILTDYTIWTYWVSFKKSKAKLIVQELHLRWCHVASWLGLAMRMHLPMRIGCASMRIDAHHPHIVQKMTSHFLPINCHFGSVFPNPWAQSPISWPI